MLIDAHFVSFSILFSFFFLWWFLFSLFSRLQTSHLLALSVLIKKEKIVYEFGSSLETGEDLFELITMPFKLDSWAGFCAGAVSLRLFFVSICSKMY